MRIYFLVYNIKLYTIPILSVQNISIINVFVLNLYLYYLCTLRKKCFIPKRKVENIKKRILIFRNYYLNLVFFVRKFSFY